MRVRSTYEVLVHRWLCSTSAEAAVTGRVTEVMKVWCLGQPCFFLEHSTQVQCLSITTQQSLTTDLFSASRLFRSLQSKDEVFDMDHDFCHFKGFKKLQKASYRGQQRYLVPFPDHFASSHGHMNARKTGSEGKSVRLILVDV